MKVLIIIALVGFLSGCGGGTWLSEKSIPGPAGPTGAPGAPGSSCTVTTLAVNAIAAPNGGSLISCQDGTSSVVLNGTNGSNGVDGAPGTPGTPGTVVTTVQFCAGATGSYPSTFPEVGVCIDNVMYGVYSANGGFFSALPPGTYSSDGINASCTFNIAANCVVN